MMDTDANGATATAGMRPDRLEDRYARALVELAETHSAVEAVTRDVAALADALAASAPLRKVLKNPILPRDAQGKALLALAGKIGAHKLTQNFLRLIAQKRRQSALAAILAAFKTELARRSGAITADVTSATALSDAQTQALTQAVAKAHRGARVTLNVTVDPTLLGGLRLRVGSHLYDRSLSAQLARLQQTLEQAA